MLDFQKLLSGLLGESVNLICSKIQCEKIAHHDVHTRRFITGSLIFVRFRMERFNVHLNCHIMTFSKLMMIKYRRFCSCFFLISVSHTLTHTNCLNLVRNGVNNNDNDITRLPKGKSKKILV